MVYYLFAFKLRIYDLQILLEMDKDHPCFLDQITKVPFENHQFYLFGNLVSKNKSYS